MNRFEADALLDLYGDLLTGRQKEILDYSIREDYSLAETAEILGISRSAVSKSLHAGLESLEHFEQAVQAGRLLQNLRVFASSLEPEQRQALLKLLENWKM